LELLDKTRFKPGPCVSAIPEITEFKNIIIFVSFACGCLLVESLTSGEVIVGSGATAAAADLQ